MRNNREDAAENRARVVDAASRLFRENGYDGIGIASLMKAARLTNGAFYKQFDSKEALIAEATAQALSENAASWKRVLATADGGPLATLTQWYLDERHLTRRHDGCAFAALAGEAPRHEEPVREAFDKGIGETIERIAAALNSDDCESAKLAAIRFLCQLVGSLTLARAVSDPGLARTILDAVRTTDWQSQ